MEGILLVAIALACPVSMGLMMVFMARGRKRPDADRPSDTDAASLDAELERLEQRRRDRVAGERDGALH